MSMEIINLGKIAAVALMWFRKKKFWSHHHQQLSQISSIPENEIFT